MVNVINLKSKSITVHSRRKDFLIGFDKASVCRHVMQTLPYKPKFDLIRGKKNHVKSDILNISLNIETDVTLFIPKYNSDVIHDVGYHINKISNDEYYNMIVKENTGIISPYHLLLEDDLEFVFKCTLVEQVSFV
jgi:hypothetical protein